MATVLPRIAAWMGGVLWIVAYGVAFVTGQRAGTPAFPVPAILLNLAWEFLFGVLSPPKSKATRAIYSGWFAADGLLWLQLFWLDPPSELGGLPNRTYGVLLVVGTTFAIALHSRLNEFLRAPHLQAYLTNLLTSGAFVWVWLARDDRAALTPEVAWLKFLGTLLITLANVQHFCRLRRAPPMALFCMGGVGALDIGYIVLLHAY